MPKHYTSSHNKKRPKTMDTMTKKQHEKFSKAVKDGILTKKQHDNLPTPLLEAIVKKKMKK
tara:strand:- start:3268 stop:3450 length:183 start_codon:yes stop_codon:yes gene_type:complete